MHQIGDIVEWDKENPKNNGMPLRVTMQFKDGLNYISGIDMQIGGVILNGMSSYDWYMPFRFKKANLWE